MNFTSIAAFHFGPPRMQKLQDLELRWGKNYQREVETDKKRGRKDTGR